MAGPSCSAAVTSDSDDQQKQFSRKRKIARACDACRRRKTKCDGPKMCDNICTNCIQSRKACTYVETSKPRGPPKAYVTCLEDRMQHMEELLKKLWPDTDFSEELGLPVVVGSWKDTEPMTSPQCGSDRDSAPPFKSASNKSFSGTLFSPSTPLGFSNHLLLNTSVSRPRRSQKRSSSEDDGDLFSPEGLSDDEQLVEDYNGQAHLSFRHGETSPAESYNHRFHGKSSALKLLDVTRRYKSLRTLDSGINDGPSPTPSISPNSLRRLEFWRAPKWELIYEGLHISSPELLPQVVDQFPPPDLCDRLIDLYFTHVNVHFPLIHRPTFKRQFSQSLYSRNIWFACLCLTIFCVSSRYSDDLRVLPRSITKREGCEADWTKAGWDYFDLAVGIHRVRRSLICPATLFEIQGLSLLTMFLQGTEHHIIAWTFVSVGIRKAQDVGAHRKTVYQSRPCLAEDLWKRAVWMLIAFARMESVSVGRPCTIGEEDFDFDLPLEVDDEYWETQDQNQANCRPTTVLSKVAAFNLWLKLTQIITFTARTIYATNPAKVIMGRSIGKPEEIVSQINAALTEWVDSVPLQLKWSDNRSDAFSNQSAMLYTSYYLAQMLVYRPFLPALNTCSSTFPFPSLSICINAARSSARIVEEQLRCGIWTIPNLISCSVISAGVLLVHVWDMKLKVRTERENAQAEGRSMIAAQTLKPLLHDINIFIKALEQASERFAVVTPSLIQIKAALPDPIEEESTQYLDSQKQASQNVLYSLNTANENMEHSQELFWDGEAVPTPLIPPPSRTGSMYSSTTTAEGMFIHSEEPSTSSSASTSFFPLTPVSSYGHRFYKHQQAVYHTPQTSDAESIRSRPTLHRRTPSGKSYSMEDDQSSHKADEEMDDPKSASVRSPPISEALSVPASSYNERRALRTPPGWDRQSKSRHSPNDNKTSRFSWDSHPHRMFHEYSHPPIPHTS